MLELMIKTIGVHYGHVPGLCFSAGDGIGYISMCPLLPTHMGACSKQTIPWLTFHYSEQYPLTTRPYLAVLYRPNLSDSCSCEPVSKVLSGTAK